MRKIAVFTGSRAEYGILRQVIKRIDQSKDLELQLVISAVHFQKKFGSTYIYVEADKFPIAVRVQMTKNREVPGKMALEVGDGIGKLAKVFLELKPDIVLLNGDRSESFAAACAAALLPIPLAHTHGGDITGGGIDESMRHAITKLAHIHFAASRQSQKRILAMGEDPEHVFLVGAPGLDDFVKAPLFSTRELEKKMGFTVRRPLIVVLEHPVTTSTQTAPEEMEVTLESVSRFPGTKVIIYPNGDPGSEVMIRVIEKYRSRDGFYIFASVERINYINLLRNADVLVGNSSGGIIETASCGLPTVNIGSRQENRERNDNVIDVPHNQKAIGDAISRCLNDRRFIAKVKKIKNVYGDGTASGKIVNILSEIKLSPEFLQKHFYSTKSSFNVAKN